MILLNQNKQVGLLPSVHLARRWKPSTEGRGTCSLNRPHASRQDGEDGEDGEAREDGEDVEDGEDREDGEVWNAVEGEVEGRWRRREGTPQHVNEDAESRAPPSVLKEAAFMMCLEGWVEF